MIRLWFPLLALAAGSLEERVRKLEAEVAELRELVGVRGTMTASVPDGTSCELRTPFDGTFRASGANAAAEVVAACRAKTKSELYCRENSVECGGGSKKK